MAMSNRMKLVKTLKKVKRLKKMQVRRKATPELMNNRRMTKVLQPRMTRKKTSRRRTAKKTKQMTLSKI